MTDKKSFILYIERRKEIEMLSNEQCGILFKAIFEYADTGNVIDIDDLAVKLMFSVFKAQINREAEKWEEVRKRRSEAGKKSGESRRNKSEQNRTKRTNVHFVEQEQTKRTVNVNVNDNVTVLSLSKDNDNIKQQACTAPKGAAQPAGFDEELYREIPLEEIDPDPDNWA
jgi:hypothetical protein